MIPSDNWNPLSSIYSDDNTIQFRRLLLSSCDNNTALYLTLLEIDVIEIVFILDAWYENKIAEYEETTGKKFDRRVNKRGMTGMQLVEMGFDIEGLLETVND